MVGAVVGIVFAVAFMPSTSWAEGETGTPSPPLTVATETQSAEPVSTVTETETATVTVTAEPTMEPVSSVTLDSDQFGAVGIALVCVVCLSAARLIVGLPR